MVVQKNETVQSANLVGQVDPEEVGLHTRLEGAQLPLHAQHLGPAPCGQVKRVRELVNSECGEYMTMSLVPLTHLQRSVGGVAAGQAVGGRHSHPHGVQQGGRVSARAVRAKTHLRYKQRNTVVHRTGLVRYSVCRASLITLSRQVSLPSPRLPAVSVRRTRQT